MPRSMKRAQFARLMRVDRSQVTRWVQLGMPTLPDGGIDAELASAWVKSHIDPTQRIRCAAERASAQRRQPMPTRVSPSPTSRRDRAQQVPPPPGCEHLVAIR
jgi:hypothetical protein